MKQKKPETVVKLTVNDFESMPVENVAMTIASIAIRKLCMEMQYKHQISRDRLIFTTDNRQLSVDDWIENDF